MHCNGLSEIQIVTAAATVSLAFTTSIASVSAFTVELVSFYALYISILMSDMFRGSAA
jgi:hypothetical protein